MTSPASLANLISWDLCHGGGGCEKAAQSPNSFATDIPEVLTPEQISGNFCKSPKFRSPRAQGASMRIRSLLVFDAISCQTSWIQTSCYIFHISLYLNIVKSSLYGEKHPQLFQSVAFLVG